MIITWTIAIIFIAAGIGGVAGALACRKSEKKYRNGGIKRAITVYDVNGEIIRQYSGKCDVTYNSERIKFDDENGKRHIIYYTTGTVIIDEE